VIYLDSSALVKLVRKEAESAALGSWLTDNDHPVVSSALVRTEVIRAVRRDSERLGARALRVLSGVETMPMTYDLLDEAGMIPGSHLRALDAIHLVSALRLRGDLDAFIAYDKRLASAAQEAGLPVVAPA
jgi:uncharacterized protein